MDDMNMFWMLVILCAIDSVICLITSVVIAELRERIEKLEKGQ